MTADDFRRIALGMQGVIEKAHMGHPDFRVNGRIFASLDANDQWGVVKLTADEQRELTKLHSRMFVAAAGAWGLQGWTKIKLEEADEAAVRGAVVMAWESTAARPGSRRTSLAKRKGVRKAAPRSPKRKN